LRKIGLVPKGGNYRTVHMEAIRLGLDTSHWLGHAHLKGKKRILPKVSLSDVLVENCEYSRSNLKSRLLKEGILDNTCAICGQLPEWHGKPLVLVIDHINGINNDNRLENLRILCPHCNSQQDTFCGRKNKGVYKTPRWSCRDCGRIISKGANRCLECDRKKARRIERPSLESLLEDRKTMSMEAVGRKYGVCGNSVKKWIIEYGAIPQPRRVKMEKRFCQTCGKEISKYDDSSFCRPCFHLQRRKVVRPSNDDIVEMRKTMTWKMIGDSLGVDQSTVRSWKE
jgi:hypothetical protein